MTTQNFCKEAEEWQKSKNKKRRVSDSSITYCDICGFGYLGKHHNCGYKYITYSLAKFTRKCWCGAEIKYYNAYCSKEHSYYFNKKRY